MDRPRQPKPPAAPDPLHRRMASLTGEPAGRLSADQVPGVPAESSCFPPPPLRQLEQSWMLLVRLVSTALAGSTLSTVLPSRQRGALPPDPQDLSAGLARGSVWGTTWCLLLTSSQVRAFSYRGVAGEVLAMYRLGVREGEDVEDITVMRMEGGGPVEVVVVGTVE